MAHTSNQPGNPEQEDERYAHNPAAEEAERDLNNASGAKRETRGEGKSDTAALQAAENNPQQIGQPGDATTRESSPWKTRVGNKEGGKEDNKKKSKAKMSKRKKRILTAVFMLIATSILGIAAFFIFLPLKMVHLVENLKESASHLVQRPAEKRFTYLLTRYIAGKIVAGEDANEFDRYVCPSGGIACTVFETWRLNRFEEKLGITIESNRTGAGEGRATNWKVTTRDGTVIQGAGGNFDEIVGQLTREINGTREMRTWLREAIKNETKWFNVIQRYGMRKMLMRKYGITGWRGPEKLENTYDNYADYKRAVKLKLKKTLSLASLGRVMKKIPSYIGCLGSDSKDCKNLQTDETPPPERPPATSEDPKAQQAIDAAEDGKTAIESESGSIDVEEIIDEVAAGGGTTDEVAKEVRSIITRRLLAAGVAGIGIIDVLASIVEKIDQGAVNAIAESKNETAYVGYSTEIMTIASKTMEGDLDPENLQAINEIFANYEKSPLAQHEMGTAATLGTEGHEVERDCDEDGKVEKLQPGEFVCPNKKVTMDVTEFITSWPAWDSVVVPAATAWNNSIGAVFDFFNDIAGGILDAIGFNKLMEWLISVTGLADLAASVFENILSSVIGSPITGAEEDAEAYDATSIGVKAGYNGMMKNGVDQEGNGMGMGGKPLTSEEIAAIHNAAARDQEEEFQNKSLMARLFDPYLTGSAANTLIARMPSNLSNILHSPVASLSSLAAPSAGAYPFRNENLAGLVIYGYAENSNVYTAPPETYTEETCKQFAEARDASYGIQGNEISPRYRIEDPCALEKVICVAGTAIYEDNKCTDEFKLYQNQPTGQETGSFTRQPGQTIKKGKGWSLQNNTDYSATPCAPGSTEREVYTHPKNKYRIRLCTVSGTGMTVTSIVSAAVVKMISDAKAAGVSLQGGAFRSYEDQIQTRKNNNCPDIYNSPSEACSPPTATPGNSEHERGLAIDFSTGISTISSGSPQFNWLQANAAKYGFYNWEEEAWHWSTSGN